MVAIGAFFAFLFLFTIELFDRNGNPYMGILAYVIAPGFLFMGMGWEGGIVIWREEGRG